MCVEVSCPPLYLPLRFPFPPTDQHQHQLTYPTQTGRDKSERLGRVSALLERVSGKIEEHRGDVPMDVRI